jgi:hypothetical protein
MINKDDHSPRNWRNNEDVADRSSGRRTITAICKRWIHKINKEHYDSVLKPNSIGEATRMIQPNMIQSTTSNSGSAAP